MIWNVFGEMEKLSWMWKNCKFNRIINSPSGSGCAAGTDRQCAVF